MFSIAGRVLDVYDDVKKDLLKANLEKIGSLRLDPVDKVAALSDDQFAGIFLTKTGRAVRKYPVHTPDSAALSNLYFENTSDGLPKEAAEIIRSNISAAYAKFGLPGVSLEKNAGFRSNIINLADMAKPMKKIASAGNFALDGRYPIDTPEQIKQAAAYFDEHHMTFSPGDRHAYAESVLARADGVNAAVSSESGIHKYAGASYGNLLQSAFHERTCLLENDVLATRTLQHLFEKKASLEPDDFAQQLERFDRTNHMDRYWDNARGIRNPYRSTYESIKIARVIKVGSASVSEEQLQGLVDNGVLKTAFSDDFCSQFAEAPMDIFQSLPSPEQQVIASMAGDM